MAGIAGMPGISMVEVVSQRPVLASKGRMSSAAQPASGQSRATLKKSAVFKNEPPENVLLILRITRNKASWQLPPDGRTLHVSLSKSRALPRKHQRQLRDGVCQPSRTRTSLLS